MKPYIAEFVGTAILVLLGNGVCAAVLLTRSKAQGSGWIVIATGWGLAVAMGVYAVGTVSGAHLNPAVSVSMATIDSFPWSKVPGYILAQMAGAMFAAALVWITYLNHWAPTEDPASKLSCYSTIPAVRRIWANFATEFIGTFMLVFGILAIAANADAISANGEVVNLAELWKAGISPLIVGFLVWAIGLSLGGPTGYAINPARDLGPRIAHRILPIAGKGGSDFAYAWVPVVAPICGGVTGAVVWDALNL